MTKDRNFDLFGDPKWPKNWASEAHILHIYKSTWNEHVKQYGCESFFESDQTPEICLTLGPKMARNWAFEAHILHISESSSNAHIKQDWREYRANVLTKYSKTLILTHLEATNGLKIGPLGPLFYIPSKVAPMSL